MRLRAASASRAHVLTAAMQNHGKVNLGIHGLRARWIVALPRCNARLARCRSWNCAWRVVGAPPVTRPGGGVSAPISLQRRAGAPAWGRGPTRLMVQPMRVVRFVTRGSLRFFQRYREWHVDLPRAEFTLYGPRLNLMDRSLIMFSAVPDPTMPRGRSAVAPLRGSAARLARRMAGILRKGQVLTLRAPVCTCGLAAAPTDAGSFDPAPPPPTIAGRAQPRAPRRPVRAAARRLAGGKPGRPGRPRPFSAPVPARQPRPVPARPRARAGFHSPTPLRPGLPGVTCS
jgi:hypothetical protein